jgi:hypothetical protein
MPEDDRRDTTTLQAILDLTSKVSDIQTELATNTNETKNIVARLDKLNGSVAKHDTSISLIERATALLTQSMEGAASRQSEIASTKKGWMDWLLKGIVVIALLLFYKLLITSGIGLVPSFDTTS